MSKIKICDLCSRKLENHRYFFTNEKYKIIYINYRNQIKEKLDICPQCFEKLKQYILKEENNNE